MKLHLTYEFESEEELRSHLSDETRSAPVVIVPAPIQPAGHGDRQTIAEEPATETRSATDVDADQMPYDTAVHSDPPQFTGDGMWRAKRGKAEEAKAARAAFKARGGAVVAPVIPSLPGLPTTVDAPSLPGLSAWAGLPADAPEPISLERVIEKITGMFQRGVVTETVLVGLYVTHGGHNDPQAAFATFNTNESARASLYSALAQIEPDLK
jgi:hypothetical protein